MFYEQKHGFSIFASDRPNAKVENAHVLNVPSNVSITISNLAMIIFFSADRKSFEQKLHDERRVKTFFESANCLVSNYRTQVHYL